MLMRVKPLIVKPVVDHRGLSFQQQDSCADPSMADKKRRLGCLHWFRMEHEDHKCITVTLVKIHVGARSQPFDDGWNRLQEQQMRFLQHECCVDQKNPSWLL